MTTPNTEFYHFTPIGYVECPQKYRFEAPRQGIYADNEGIIRLVSKINLETAVRDLAGFDRIWVIYCFHLNDNWKPTVRPPICGENRKIGVLATRSPHRPNPIGMSCVELVGVNGLELHIRNFDMLDGSPVLDIKPYIPAADAFSESRTGWLPPPPPGYEVEFSHEAQEQAEFIRELSGLDLMLFCRTQLGIDPLNAERKRVLIEGDDGIIGCRTWKIKFHFNATARQIKVTEIKSAYADSELAPDAEDQYDDKEFHRRFLSRFPR